MQEQLNPSKNMADAGLDTFISEVDADELLTNTTHILLPTLVQNSHMVRTYDVDINICNNF